MTGLARPDGRKLRIFSIYHSAVVPEYRRRFLPLVAPGDVALELLTPAAWTQFNRWQESPPLEPALEALGVRLHRVAPWGSALPSHTLRNVFHVYPDQEARLCAAAPDLVEVWEEPYSLAALQAARIVARIEPRPRLAVFSAQNLFKPRPWPIAGFEREVLGAADLMLPVSAEVEGVLRLKGYRGPAVVLPLGLDLDVFRPGQEAALRAELGLAGTVIGFVGKLQPEKGAHVLLEAFARLGPDATLLIAGEGPERGRLERRAAALGRADRVRFTGPIPHARMPAHYRAMDVLVVPSLTVAGWKEQFGRVVVEGLATGLPVIGSDSGEIPRVLGEAGVVVPEGDPAALAKALAELPAGSARARELAARGRARAAEHFSWEAVAARQRQAYRELLAGPARSSGSG